MRRALLLLAVLFAFLVPVSPARAATKTINISAGQPETNPVGLSADDKVKWHNKDDVPHVIHLEGDEIFVDAMSDSDVQGPLAPGTHNYTVQDDKLVVGAGQLIVAEPATTTTQQATTTTKASTTTSSSTTSTSSTTSSTTTTTTPLSSFSGPISINSGGKSGSSSALPLLLGALVLVAALAGFAYWLWWRSGDAYEEDDDGPDWTQEPPTVQGPRI